MVGVFDQVAPGQLSVRTVEPTTIGGRASLGGVRVQPVQPGDSDLPPGDPLTLGASRAAGTEPAQLPIYQETREAAQQDVSRFPWWLLALIGVLAMA
jgi:hypothetical protein